MSEYNYRVRFITDEGAEFEECNGKARPLTEAEYKGNEYMHEGQPVSYAEYRRYYGNPERHVYLGCIVERQPTTGGRWHQAAGLWRIDFMDDNPEIAAVELDDNHNGRSTYTPDQAMALPGYLSTVAAETLEEGGYQLPAHVYCKRRGCHFWHVKADEGDPRYCAGHQQPKKRSAHASKGVHHA